MTTNPAPPGGLLAKVAVADATVYYDKLYSYLVPALLEGHIFVGSLVLAPFGRGRARPRLGVVVELEPAPEKPDVRLKELADAAPAEAALSEELLDIVKYLREVTFCTWFEAVRAVLPRGAQYKVVQEDDGWHLRRQMPKSMQTVYGPAATVEETLKKPTEKQQRVLDFVSAMPHSQAEICAGCDVGPGVVRTLVQKGLLVAAERESRDEMDGFEPAGDAGLGDQTEKNGQDGPPGGYVLTDEQQKVAAGLLREMEDPRPKPALLYGVTGSGKTAVFIHLAQAALERGKSVLVLVPEIGLTPQMLASLRAAFGSAVAVQHSGLSATERLAQWRAARDGAARVVVGTRSAVFMPLTGIGLIVVDEEQEHTYHSETSPRYDAVDVARRRAARHGALLLLSSATPSVGAFYAAQQGRYSLHVLAQRYGNLPLPAVEMVDMGLELLAGNTGAVSRQLADELRETLAGGGQAILLLNRRGYHRVALCRECGKSLKCEECSVPMVLHKHRCAAGGTHSADDENEGGAPDGYLLCHHCQRSIDPAPAVCPECGGALRYAGFGTQKLEEELAEILPGARILRMDMDTTQRKGAHEGMLRQFADGRYDILLGTQMVAKGLDFERVRLVGVIGIDSLLFAQGYRAFEHVFSLVTQVVGRSGRGPGRPNLALRSETNLPAAGDSNATSVGEPLRAAGGQGHALIQTVDVTNPVLKMAAAQDYERFYEEEIAFRKLMLYPPFCVLCVVGFVAAEAVDALAAAKAFAGFLAARAGEAPKMPLRVLGPAPMAVARLAGSYRYRLTLKCRGDAAFRALVRRALDDYNKEGWPKRATAFLDFHSEG